MGFDSSRIFIRILGFSVWAEASSLIPPPHDASFPASDPHTFTFPQLVQGCPCTSPPCPVAPWLPIGCSVLCLLHSFREGDLD